MRDLRGWIPETQLSGVQILALARLDLAKLVLDLFRFWFLHFIFFCFILLAWFVWFGCLFCFGFVYLLTLLDLDCFAYLICIFCSYFLSMFGKSRKTTFLFIFCLWLLGNSAKKLPWFVALWAWLSENRPTCADFEICLAGPKLHKSREVANIKSICHL